MTQTHPTSEVAALVPTETQKEKKSLRWTLRPPQLPHRTRFSPKTVLIHQEEKSFSLGLTAQLRFHAGGQ